MDKTKRQLSKLNFGCGNDVRSSWVNVDIKLGKGIDKSFDFNCFPYPFKDESFGEIFSDNVLKHLENIPLVMKELHRIAKPGAKIRIIVPYYNCYGAYNDVTHVHHFNEYAFEPFYKKDTRSNYFIKEKFELEKLSLIPTRFGKLFLFDFLRKPLSKVLGQIFQTIDLTLRVIK